MPSAARSSPHAHAEGQDPEAWEQGLLQGCTERPGQSRSRGSLFITNSGIRSELHGATTYSPSVTELYIVKAVES